MIMFMNLRGVKEAGVAFAIPTYFFLLMMYATIVFGFVRLILGTLGVVDTPPMDFVEIQSSLQPITLFLFLKHLLQEQQH